MDLINATKENILSHFGLYHEMIKIMTAVDHKAPEGSCCGKNKEKNINIFIANREKYLNRMKEIKERKIKPLWHGIIFVSKLSKHFNSETITDNESLMIIEKKALNPTEKYFDLSAYNEVSDVKIEEEYNINEETKTIDRDELNKEYEEFIENLKENSEEQDKLIEETLPSDGQLLVTFQEVDEKVDDEIVEEKVVEEKHKSRRGRKPKAKNI